MHNRDNIYQIVQWNETIGFGWFLYDLVEIDDNGQEHITKVRVQIWLKDFDNRDTIEEVWVGAYIFAGEIDFITPQVPHFSFLFFLGEQCGIELEDGQVVSELLVDEDDYYFFNNSGENGGNDLSSSNSFWQQASTQIH